jgi:hypothetical protein
MRKKGADKNNSGYKAWSLDQLTKSQFFHEKLHSWGLLEVASGIEEIKGEGLDWNLELLGITKQAWEKVIHRGIKPVIVFAHTEVLKHLPGALGYYRMLSMVSQKSMIRVGLPSARYETGRVFPNDEAAEALAVHLNKIISTLIELDEEINAREFDLWRGMAAGAQAQGSWQNTKGSKLEIIIRGLLQRRLREKDLVVVEKALLQGDEEYGSIMQLKDGRVVIFADEPDIAVHESDENIVVAVEIKGGIDTAGVLERIGASIKSLRRAKESNPESKTILILQGISLSDTARKDLEISRDVVNHWFTVEEILEEEDKREMVFELLGV